MSRRGMNALVLATVLVVGFGAGCSSVPAFRATALVRVRGDGETAWRNAERAARAVSLRQNLVRLMRELRYARLRMLDVEEPLDILQDAIMASRDGKGLVSVRVYGNARYEVNRLCEAVLNLWESEGMIGSIPSSGFAQRERVRRGKGPDMALAREKSRLEDKEQRLYKEKQRILGRQVTLGETWQSADAALQREEGLVLAARKNESEKILELRRIRSILARPAHERYRALNDPDVLRLHADVERSEQELRRERDGERKARLARWVQRKRRALDHAQRRFERSAQASLRDARTALRAARRARDEARRRRDGLASERSRLARRLKEIGREVEEARGRLKRIRHDETDLPRPGANPDVKVYHLRRIVQSCRVRRLKD